MADPRNVVLLGATGSIGENTLAVLRAFPERFRLLGVAANRNRDALQAIVEAFSVPHARLFCESGLDGLMELACLPEADVIIVATTGTIGLRPTLAALEAGKTVGLANKETLVLGGAFVLEAARRGGGRLLPVDSEHNAIFQCLQALGDARQLRRILLTASGGPFLRHTRRELQAVTKADALRHPNWDMGPKVTIDSATLANKGLEMMEARWLFELQPQQIEVVIHPQSIIHSMVECSDGSVIAQLSPPSMTYPIQHVLAWPDRVEQPTQPGLDFSRIQQLELRPPDESKFPCLRLARQALTAGGIAPAVFNAANEVAVEAFLADHIGFGAIPRLIDACLQKAAFPSPSDLPSLLLLEGELIAFARDQLDSLND